MPHFEPGHSIGAETRFKPGQSGNPGGRPKGLATIARAVLAEATAEGDMTKAEALMRRLYDLAVNEGNVQAIKLLLDREWPAPNRHETSRDDVPMVIVRNYTGLEFEERAVPKAAREFDERLIPGTVEDPPEATPEPTVRAPDEPEASGWAIQRPDDDDRDTTAVL